jgi:acylphosphatase
MKTRATIIVAGDVQEVGFRAYAMNMGQKMKLTGYAENMFDGTVQVVCEGEKSVIEDYIKRLKTNESLAKIENVEVKYSTALGEFKGFRVKIDDQGSEMFQGFATAGRLLTELRGDVRKGNAELKDTIIKGNAGLGNKIDNLGDRIDDNFNKMEQKYDVISKSILVAIEELKQSRDEQKETRAEVKAIVENLTKVVQTFTEQHKK